MPLQSMSFPTLADGEEHFLIPGPTAGLRLFLRRLGGRRHQGGERRAVLYVHGATFPSALSIACRFDGRSWRDALCAAGFDVWGLDFYGFGFSDRYAAMDGPADAEGPLCLAADAAAQLEVAVRFILERESVSSLSIIGHSWGTMVAARFAAAHPERVDRIVMFGPICRREPVRYAARPDGPAWKIITAQDQWERFVEDVPEGEPPVLSRRHFDSWAEHYLDSDPESRQRDPPGVKTPTGPFFEILRAWHGEMPYDPSEVRAPVAIIRGAWDGLATDADARWLFDALSASPSRRDIKIARGTHLMHLETMRPALWQESIAFLAGGDVADLPDINA